MLVAKIAVLLLLTLLGSLNAANNVQVVNNRMMLNGVEFIVKGLGYSPTPIGRGSVDGSGYGGTGLCSSKLTPWNEWKSACYDSDYFDGSTDINPDRFPNGFADIWRRDLPNIKATGANTLRLYNTNPSTKEATKVYTNLFLAATGKDHTQFMDFCAQNGLMVIFPLFSDNWAYANYDTKTYKRYLRWQIDEVGNHPALLMWQLGNEMDWTWRWNSLWNSNTAMAKYNDYVAYIRRYTLSKWGRVLPVTNGLVNDGQALTFQYQNLQLDVLSVNVFGTSFGDLFSGNSNGWQGVTKLSCQYNRPFLMTEIGWTYLSGKDYPQGSFNQIWDNVIKNIPNGLLGACYFEQTDEPALGKNFGLWEVKVQNNADGTNSNQKDVWTPDAVAPKQQFYDIVNGSYNGVPKNMNLNVFTALGRSPYKPTTVVDYCTSVGTYKTCPSGNTYFKCSGVGNCDRATGTCSCMQGWSGTGCQTATCPSNCNGRGVCSTNVSPPECACNRGYYGTSCEFKVATPNGTCPNSCSGNGICNTYNSVCKCHPGWIGHDCSVTDFGKGILDIQQFYASCYRASSNPAVITSTIPNLTNQKCMYYCGSRGYSFSYTSGGNLCNCENVDPSTQTKYVSSCTLACNGDTSQRCGGSGYGSVYRTGGISGTGYIGCYIDNGNRDLPTFMGNTNDVDGCRQLCVAGGYAYAGLQAGGQCFCGNTYGGQGGAAPETDCNWPCGDNTLKCGAGWRNSVYVAELPQGYDYPQ